jgi:hypothetical protein
VTAGHAGAENRRRDALAYLCAHLAEIRHALPRSSDSVTLERLLAVLEAGRIGGSGGCDTSYIDGLLDHLHAELRASGDALGLYGNLPGHTAHRGVRPVGISSRPALSLEEVVYVCPTGTCSRYCWPQGSTATPQCGIRRQALRRDRL